MSPTYKVNEGKTFGLLKEGEEVQLTEEEAAPHLSKLTRAADTRNDLNMVIPEDFKLIHQTEDGDATTVVEEKDYSSLTVPELQEELRVRQLETTGKKAELIARLEESDEENK